MTIIPDISISVLHVTPHLSRSGGGVAEAIWGLVRSTTSHGMKHSAVAVRDAPGTDSPVDAPDGCDIRLFDSQGPRSIFLSPALGVHLRQTLHSHDVVHVHSIRHWPGLMARRCAASFAKPLLISLHGMLYPEHLKRSRFRKKIIHALFEDATLRAAQCLHATSMQELDSIRQFGCRNPVALIPLGIDSLPESTLSREDENRIVETKWSLLAGKRRLLYLGMLDPKKGLLRLIAAWSQVQHRHPDWLLTLVGPGIGDFETHVRNEIDRYNLRSRVALLGPLYETDKAMMLRQSDLLVLPSDWENFGIVVGEALAAGLPAIATRKSPWKTLEDHECGWWVDPTVELLVSTLERALSLSKQALRERGQRGKVLIASKFSWCTAGDEMAAVYEWLTGRRVRPPCVQDGA